MSAELEVARLSDRIAELEQMLDTAHERANAAAVRACVCVYAYMCGRAEVTMARIEKKWGWPKSADADVWAYASLVCFQKVVGAAGQA